MSNVGTFPENAPGEKPEVILRASSALLKHGIEDSKKTGVAVGTVSTAGGPNCSGDSGGGD
jgi:hypothetical protein